MADEPPFAPRAPWFTPALALVALAGLGLRTWHLLASRVDRVPVFEQGDAFWYSTVAINLGDGRLFRNLFTGSPTADHPPLTVLLLGPTSWLFGTSTFAQRVTMVVLGTATIAVVGLAVRNLAGPRAGIAAAAVAALAPALWVNDVLVMSETPTALVVALVLWAGIALSRRPSLRLAAVAGALCGLAALSRAETGLFLPLMVWPLVALARPLPAAQRLRLAGAATLATLVVLAPWTLLNLGRFEEPVAISTNDGLTLAGANCAETYHGAITGGWTLTPCVVDGYARIEAAKPDPAPALPAGTDPNRPCGDPEQHRLPCLDPSQVSKVLRQQGTRYVRAHLGDLPKVVAVRNARVWGLYGLDQAIGTGSNEGRTPWVTRLGFQVTWLLVPFTVAGAVLLRRRGTTVVPFVASVAIVVVVSTAFYGLVRFRLPYDVASCFLAGVAIAAVWDRLSPPLVVARRRSQRALMPLAVTIAIDSVMIRADIFEVPSARSTKVMGTSTILRSACTMRWASSLMKA
ncbi:glycosyltransferase family 39 protein [Aquihabitans sp. G128]|nr:glycosyltransferase family 39 protein [Aquihabitans sp. G128]